MNQNDAVRALQDAAARGALVPFVGAGVSMASANLPSWPQLVDNWIDYLRVNKGALNLTSKEIKNLTALRKVGTPGAFEPLRTCILRSPHHYAYFLNAQFGRPTVSDPQLLRSLASLGAKLIVTTNYDHLLDALVSPDALKPTWKEPTEMLRVLRSRNGVIHLHGRYDDPDSVVLTPTEYAGLPFQSAPTRVASSLFDSAILLFIGTSLDGVTDPHLGKILAEFKILAAKSSTVSQPHFILLREPLDSSDEVEFRELGIQPVVYGNSFSDLPGFLEKASQSTVQISVPAVLDPLGDVRRSKSLDDVLKICESFIRDHVYQGREVRINFVEKKLNTQGTELSHRALIPRNATDNRYSYPLTVAAWALIEGVILAWPHDSARKLDFKRLTQLKKAQSIKAMICDQSVLSEEGVQSYLDAGKILQGLQDNTLTLADIYQNWVGRQPNPHYDQFVSLPVPLIRTVPNNSVIPEYGVFNIDCLYGPPLLDHRTGPLLAIASEMAALGFQMHKDKT